MRRFKRDIRYLVLRLVAAMMALFSTRIRMPLRETTRAWRRAYGYRLLRLHGLAPIAGGATLVASRSPLFYRSVPGGTPSIIDVTKFTGNVFYVDSAVGTDGAGHGSTPDDPLATIDYAIGLCTANQGDVILVLPGHAETVATLITCDKAGVRIIGMGEGNDRPALTVSAVIDGISITADDVTVEGIRFPTPSAAATSLINIAAARAKIRRCRQELGANVVDAITVTAAGEEPTWEDNEVVVTADGPDSWLKFEGVVDLPIIRRNVVVGSDGTNAFDDGVLDFGGQAVTNALIYDNEFGDGNAAVTVFANGGSVVGEVIGINKYGALATNADTVGFPLADDAITAAKIAANAIGASEIAAGAIDADALAADCITAAKIADDAIAAEHIATGAIVAATFAAGAIDAAAIAAAAIDAATFAADALQAFQDEAEDALEGENLDHLLQLDGATQVYPEQAVADSIIAKMIAKGDPATPSTYSCVTDSQEALSDKMGGFSGDGGAAQDDSAKASLDLVHTDLDNIILDTQYLRTLDGATQVYPENVVSDSIIAKIIAKGDPADPTTYSCVTDSLEAQSDKLGGFSGDGGAAQDDSVKASLDLAHTDLDSILTNLTTIDDFLDTEIAAILSDTGTDGVVIAADGITAAKIADDAFASEHFAASAGEYTTDGVVITRATAAVPQSTSVTLFTVTGLVLLKRIVGRVTTVLGAATPNNSKLKVDTTGAGATTDLCADLDLDAEAVDTILQITGTFANPMVATLDLPIAKQQVTEVVIPPGSIQLECDGSDGGTGRIQWSVTYVPLEAGASIVAA